MDGMITAGRVGGLFGNKGELTLVLYDPFPRDPNKEEPLFVEIDGHAVPLFLERFSRRGVRGATVVFADIDTADRAAGFVGREFYLRAGGGAGADVGGEADDELYFEDLVGWEAEVGEMGDRYGGHSDRDGRGGCKGRITAFFDNEFNPLLEIELDGTTELIPAQEDFIVGIDEQHRRVTFSLPEGLLGLNESG